MRILSTMTILVLFFASSCEKNEKGVTVTGEPDVTLAWESAVNPMLIIGDSNAKIRVVDALVEPQNRCQSIEYGIDVDFDMINDLSFYVYYCYSPGFFTATFRLDCLNENISILCNDTILTPEILSYGDTLHSDKLWVNSTMEMLRARGTSEMVGGDGIIYKYGNWFNLSNKYIGLKFDFDNHSSYGWIKLSVPNDNWIHSMTIHEIALRTP
jgi:hypothetical protein